MPAPIPGRRRPAKEFFAEYARKHSTAFILAASVILLFESAMIVRAFFVFNFAKRSHQLYFVSYVFLFLATLAGLVFVVRNRRGKVTPAAITLALHLYSTAIILWSLLVSCLDLKNGNSPIVYLTVIMSIGGLSVIYPVYYAVNILLSFGILLAFNRTAELPYFQSNTGGVFINISIFVIISLFLAFRNYAISRRDAEMTDYLQELSFRDQLTGCRNRRMYDSALSRFEKEDTELLAGIIDLDSFKTINDTYGHDFGDTCLTDVARRLMEAFGECVYRIGGDEFAVLSESAGRAEAKDRIDAINQALEKAFPDKSVSISAGFSLRAAGGGTSAEAVVKEADGALYLAKAEGRKRCRFAGQ